MLTHTELWVVFMIHRSVGSSQFAEHPTHGRSQQGGWPVVVHEYCSDSNPIFFFLKNSGKGKEEVGWVFESYAISGEKSMKERVCASVFVSDFNATTISVYLNRVQMRSGQNSCNGIGFVAFWAQLVDENGQIS